MGFWTQCERCNKKYYATGNTGYYDSTRYCSYECDNADWQEECAVRDRQRALELQEQQNKLLVEAERQQRKQNELLAKQNTQLLAEAEAAAKKAAEENAEKARREANQRMCRWCGQKYDFQYSGANDKSSFCGRKCEIDFKANEPPPPPPPKRKKPVLEKRRYNMEKVFITSEINVNFFGNYALLILTEVFEEKETLRNFDTANNEWHGNFFSGKNKSLREKSFETKLIFDSNSNSYVSENPLPGTIHLRQYGFRNNADFCELINRVCKLPEKYSFQLLQNKHLQLGDITSLLQLPQTKQDENSDQYIPGAILLVGGILLGIFCGIWWVRWIIAPILCLAGIAAFNEESNKRKESPAKRDVRSAPSADKKQSTSQDDIIAERIAIVIMIAGGILLGIFCGIWWVRWIIAPVLFLGGFFGAINSK